MTTVCDSCGSDDINVLTRDVSFNNGEYPPMDFVTVDHCICNQCFQEWVE